jgi:hypothetical protein
MKSFLLGFILLLLTVGSILIFENVCNKQIEQLTTTNAQSLEKEKAVSSSKVEITWIPSTYRGIILGKSKYEDVIKLLGTPGWKGDNEEKTFENDDEFEILLQYPNKGVEQEAVEIVIGKKTKIVKALSYIPYPEITKQEAISKYGLDYFEISSGESVCTKNTNPDSSKGKLNYPILLVYPQKGLYVLVNENDQVLHIGYLYKCTE